MKTLIQFLLLALLVGCASPYYPVYVNDAGDYYIAERATEGPYYGTGYYPWWLSAYPPQTFAYYSPYFYPYYFSIWYPGGNRMVSPVLPPVIDSRQVVVYPGLPINRELVNRGGKWQRIVAPPRSASVYNHTPVQPSVPASRMSSSRPAKLSVPSTHSGSARRGKADSRSRSVRYRQ